MAVSAEPLTASATNASRQEAIVAKRFASWTDIPLFSIYGLLNNGLVCVAYGAAQDVVKTFGFQDSAPLVVTMSNIAAIVGPSLLMVCPLRYAGYRTKVCVATLLGICGSLLMAVSAETLAADSTLESKSPLGFVLAMAAVLLLGLQQSLGENIACVRFQRCSKLAFSMWGAGTGLAGIFPPILYGLVSKWRLAFRFLAVVPVLVVYFATCLCVYAASRREAVRSYIQDNVIVTSDVLEDSDVRELHRQRSLTTEAEEQAIQVADEAPPPPSALQAPAELVCSSEPQPLPPRQISQGSACPSSSAFALYVTCVYCGVYGLEYFIFPTLVERSTKCPITSPLGQGAYNTSWICYNIGVTLSRGSIALFQFPCLWLVLVLQAANVVLWGVEVHSHFIPRMGGNGYILQYVWMVWVGLMGGTAYSNCLRAFHCSPRIPNDRRDRLINTAFAVANIVILSSTVMGTVLDNTILTTETVRQNCPKVQDAAIVL